MNAAMLLRGACAASLMHGIAHRWRVLLAKTLLGRGPIDGSGEPGLDERSMKAFNTSVTMPLEPMRRLRHGVQKSAKPR